MTEAFAVVNGIKICYSIQGKGFPSLLLHGFGSKKESFIGQIPELSRHFKVIAMDMRGAGKSSRPNYHYSMDMFVEDIKGLIDYLNIKKVNLIAHSFGGMIAQNYALKYPETVENLVLISTTGGNRMGIPVATSRRLNPEERATMTSDELGDETLRLCVTSEFIDDNPETAGILKEAMINQSEPAYSMLRQAEALRGHDTYDRLPEIAVPTLLIAGEADVAIPAGKFRNPGFPYT